MFAQQANQNMDEAYEDLEEMMKDINDEQAMKDIAAMNLGPVPSGPIK